MLNIFLLHQLMTAAAAYNDLDDGCFMTQQEAGMREVAWVLGCGIKRIAPSCRSRGPCDSS